MAGIHLVYAVRVDHSGHKGMGCMAGTAPSHWLPSLRLVTISAFARKPVFGSLGMVYAMASIGVLGMLGAFHWPIFGASVALRLPFCIPMANTPWLRGASLPQFHLEVDQHPLCAHPRRGFTTSSLPITMPTPLVFAVGHLFNWTPPAVSDTPRALCPRLASLCLPRWVCLHDACSHCESRAAQARCHWWLLFIPMGMGGINSGFVIYPKRVLSMLPVHPDG